MLYNRFDLISIYRSQDEKEEIFQDILNLIDTEKPTIILGDLNLNILKCPEHSMLRNLKDLSFKQLVQTPTHEQGGLLDLVFLSHHFNQNEVTIENVSVYYSDHDLIHIKMNL